MNEKWKSRFKQDIDIRKVIDDYEAKLCELHTKNLLLAQDIITEDKRYKDLHRDYYNMKERYNAESTMNIMNRQVIQRQSMWLNRISTVVRAKWWNRLTMAKLLYIDIMKNVRGF